MATPKGKLLIIGGAEDKGGEGKDIQLKNVEYERLEILKELLPKNGKKRIEVITTASGVPEEMEKMYSQAFEEIGYSNTGFIHIKEKPEARNPEYSSRLEQAHAVFFTGGDQLRLSGILGGTDTISVIKQKFQHDDDFVVAGTSAGAMAMSSIMIYEGGVHEAIFKDDVKITGGLGILKCCIIDTHFIKRGRFGRLAHTVTMNPEELGIGLGEDTALIITKGYEAECRGSGMVVIIDGSEIDGTNITEARGDSPIYVENLKVHLLVKGNKFNIQKRKMIFGNPEEQESKKGKSKSVA